MHDHDAELRATLARVVLTDLRSGRARLTAPSVAALRVLTAGPEEPLPSRARRRRTRRPLHRAGAAVAVGVGIAAATCGLVLAGAGRDSPPRHAGAPAGVAAPPALAPDSPPPAFRTGGPSPTSAASASPPAPPSVSPSPCPRHRTGASGRSRGPREDRTASTGRSSWARTGRR
jgi:hypothetical protein